MTYPILLLAGRFVLASALLMVLYWIVWRKQSTYRAKRMYLLTMPVVALIISLLQVEVYKQEPVVVEVTANSHSPILSQGRDADTVSIANQPKGEVANTATVSALSIEKNAISAAIFKEQDSSLPPFGKGWLYALAYTLLIIVLYIPFVVNLVMMRHLRKEASISEEDKEADIRILMGATVKASFSFHRTIFLPTNLTEAQRRMVLAHERAHILHRHYVDVWVSEVITRLLWFNPFLWWARQELRNVHEFEADSEVLGTGEDVYAYQAILIEEVLHGDIVIANGFNHSFIRRRFVEMLQSTNCRMTSLAKAGTAAWMFLIVALMCCTVGEAETVYKTVASDELQATSSQGEETVLTDSRQWTKAKAIEAKDYLPQAISQLGNEHAGAFLQLISTINSIREINHEQYEALKKTYPAGTLPGLDSINSNVRELKGSLEAIMLEGMTGLQTGLHKRLTELLHSSGLDTLKLEREEEPQQHSFTAKGNPTFIDAQGKSHEYSTSDYDTTFTMESQYRN